MDDCLRCTECNHKERSNGKYCSECGYFLKGLDEEKESKGIILFFRKNITPILVGIFLIILVWTFFLPAPYSLRYLFKLAFYKPTAVCRDGIYSFSPVKSGSCSGHGGVRSWIRSE